MESAALCKLNRGKFAVMTAAALCAFAAPAGAATKNSTAGTDVAPAYGGTQYYATPTISALQCQTGCSKAAKVSQSGWVKVKEKGLLRVRGRHLDSVGKVLFVGLSGKSDNVGVVPTRRTAGTLDVKVPQLANNGKVVLLDPAGHSSKPSDARVSIMRDPNAASAQGLVWPVKNPLITGVFGENRGDHIHTGDDLAVPYGTSIHAAASGIVILMGPQGGYGNFTCIRHPALVTCYAHQSKFLTKYGAYVRQGQVIGKVGCTGNCSGPHVHFEVRKGPDAWSKPMDPLKFLPRR